MNLSCRKPILAALLVAVWASNVAAPARSADGDGPLAPLVRARAGGDGLGLVTGDMKVSDILPALWVSIALTAAQSALCMAGIRKKQL